MFVNEFPIYLFNSKTPQNCKVEVDDGILAFYVPVFSLHFPQPLIYDTHDINVTYKFLKLV